MKFQLASSGSNMDQQPSRTKSGNKNKTASSFVSEKDNGKRLRRRSSVDSGALSLNKLSLPCQREKSSLSDTTDKRRKDRSNSFSFTSKRERDTAKKDDSSKKESTCTKSNPYLVMSSSVSVGCEVELKPILKPCARTNGLRHTVSLDDALASETKKFQTSENKFSYRLPDASKKTSIRKSVSFREDSSEEQRNRPRRYSSPSCQLTFSPTKTICPEFVDPI